MKRQQARFSLPPMFRNGPRRQGSAPENLFKSEKIFLCRAERAESERTQEFTLRWVLPVAGRR